MHLEIEILASPHPHRVRPRGYRCAAARRQCFVEALADPPQHEEDVPGHRADVHEFEGAALHPGVTDA